MTLACRNADLNAKNLKVFTKKISRYCVCIFQELKDVYLFLKANNFKN